MPKTDEQQEKLPPWRIEHVQGELRVTDGIIAIACSNGVKALACLSEVSTTWPNGTAKASAPELARADYTGFKRGQRLGLAVGTLLGVTLSAIVAYASLAWQL